MNGSGASPAALTLDIGQRVAYVGALRRVSAQADRTTPIDGLAGTEPTQGSGAGRSDSMPAPKDGMDPFSVHCVTVPGACALWVDAAARLGRLPLATLLAPAIALARDGFPVGPITAVAWAEEAERLLRTSPNGGEMLDQGRAPQANAIMRLPNLAKCGARSHHQTPPVPARLTSGWAPDRMGRAGRIEAIRTLEAVAAEGKAVFYEGYIAQAIVDAVQR